MNASSFSSCAGCHVQDHPSEPEPASAPQALSARRQQRAAGAGAGKKRSVERLREGVQPSAGTRCLRTNQRQHKKIDMQKISYIEVMKECR